MNYIHTIDDFAFISLPFALDEIIEIARQRRAFADRGLTSKIARSRVYKFIHSHRTHPRHLEISPTTIIRLCFILFFFSLFFQILGFCFLDLRTNRKKQRRWEEGGNFVKGKASLTRTLGTPTTASKKRFHRLIFYFSF